MHSLYTGPDQGKLFLYCTEPTPGVKRTPAAGTVQGLVYLPWTAPGRTQVFQLK